MDPFYMIMLMHRLGRSYVVWGKAATIRFRKPGRDTLFARLAVDDAEIAEIQNSLENNSSIDRVYTVDLTDAEGVVHATVEKTVYIRKKIEN